MEIPRTVIMRFVPPSELLPNARRRNHWRETAEATKRTRQIAVIEALNGWNGDPPMDGPLDVAITIVWPKGRKACDVDALAGLCKPVLDGCSGICWHDDAQLQRISYEAIRNPAALVHFPDGCTTITVKAWEQAAG